MHTPVLLAQVLSHINTQTDTRYIDATFGEGGHTKALLEKGLAVLAIDADQSQLDAAAQLPITPKQRANLTTRLSNYAFVADVAEEAGFVPVDGILFDLGLSMKQLTSERGFSYQFLHQPLDMVIGTIAKQRGTARAADVVAVYDVQALRKMFEQYSERLNAQAIANAIVQRRIHKPIKTVGDLLSALKGEISDKELPAVFQALRIEVNEELEAIEMGLAGAIRIIRPGGHLQVITFHSIEDRTVKLWAREQKLTEVAKYVGRRVSEKSFERSAVLRVYQIAA